MNKKSAAIMWWLILIVEAAVLVAMLLNDFGIISTNTNPLTLRGIIYHLLAVVLIVMSAVNLKKLKK
ncbi:MAG: hypothetical protein Q4A83_06225 [Bacillota bacterium]|nr:hypothetical protein [Bacillota bacterium]